MGILQAHMGAVECIGLLRMRSKEQAAQDSVIIIVVHYCHYCH